MESFSQLDFLKFKKEEDKESSPGVSVDVQISIYAICDNSKRTCYMIQSDQ